LLSFKTLKIGPLRDHDYTHCGSHNAGYRDGRAAHSLIHSPAGYYSVNTQTRRTCGERPSGNAQDQRYSKIAICGNPHKKPTVEIPHSDSQIQTTKYRIHISTPESDSEEEIHFSDLEGNLIAAPDADLHELEYLEAEIDLARLNLYGMNVNPQPAVAQPPSIAAAPPAQGQGPAQDQGPPPPGNINIQPLAQLPGQAANIRNQIPAPDAQQALVQDQAQIGAGNNPLVVGAGAVANQMFFPAINMFSEERMLCPAPFSGRADEDATEFWRRFQNYLEFKPIVGDADKLRLIKAMCVDQAADWAEKLDPAERTSFTAFKHAFESRWIKPDLLKFRSAREMFTKKQMPDESVDSYANRTRKLANRIDASDETLRYAFVSGLRPKIASFVLSKEPESMNKALDAARIAEMSLGEAYEAENAELTGQLTEIRRELKKWQIDTTLLPLAHRFRQITQGHRLDVLHSKGEGRKRENLDCHPPLMGSTKIGHMLIRRHRIGPQ